jgi:preprotein translocase subunit Sec63
MTTTAIIVILGGAALGCWLVAVLCRSSRHRGDTLLEPPVFEADPPWHEVLDVSADASRETIDAAHQTKRAGYLPERVARLRAGARHQAQHRIMQIDRAYAAAMRELGLGRGGNNEVR